MHWLASALGGIGFFFAALFGAPPPAPPAPPPPPSAASTTPAAGSAVVSADVENSPAPAAAASSTARDASAALPAGSAWLATLPLGDGKYVTSGPKADSVYLCHIATGGSGAEGSATWIHGASWTPAEKVAVAGSVAWPTASYAMTVAGATRTLVGNGLPTDHPSGTFPIALSDPAHRFDGNPNSIKAQSYDFALPAYPVAAAAPGCIYGQVGIMQDGVALFDGFDAEYRDAVAHETQDAWEAHPDNSGQYHYHGFETGYVKDPVSTVVGFAFDGYPITGSLLPSGNYLHTADLDECHGLTSAVTLDGKQVTTYHYVLTQDFPYSVSCFHAASHEPKPGPAAKQGGANGARPSGPPRPS